MSVPIPAANSMAAHEKRENSGLEFAGPRRTLPYLEKPKNKTKIMMEVARPM